MNKVNLRKHIFAQSKFHKKNDIKKSKISWMKSTFHENSQNFMNNMDANQVEIGKWVGNF